MSLIQLWKKFTILQCIVFSQECTKNGNVLQYDKGRILLLQEAVALFNISLCLLLHGFKMYTGTDS